MPTSQFNHLSPDRPQIYPKLTSKMHYKCLKQEFIVTSAEKLDKVDRIIDKLQCGEEDGPGANYGEFQLHIHRFKGFAGTYGFDSVSLIAHRLEYYIENTRQLTSENLLDR